MSESNEQWEKDLRKDLKTGIGLAVYGAMNVYDASIEEIMKALTDVMKDVEEPGDFFGGVNQNDTIL